MAQPARFNRVYWDDAYPIALMLKQAHPEVDPAQVSREQVHTWTTQLDDFADDGDAFMVELLEDIQAEWMEIQD